MRTQELRELGEFPEDADRPFSFIERMRHHTLNVADDRAFAFSTQLVDSYLQLFRSKRFNICADETFDLGKGKSKQEAQRVGVAALYATYVGKLCEHLSKQGREPMFWGDIAVEMPEILETLPNNVTLLNWQYEPEATDEKIQLVAQAGAKQIVCPAVWGWNALLPRIDDAWNNISRIARYGIDCGAEGMLVTDWGDFGHINDPRMAVPGMIFGAHYAWNPAEDSAGKTDGNTAENSAGDSAENDLLERISRVEYGDCSARFVTLLRNASAQAVFTWRELVEYLELDDGTGNCNTDVAQTIPCLADRLVDHLSDCGNAMTVREARNRMMRNMATTIKRIPQANRELQQCMVDIAPIAAHMGNPGITAAVRIAMEGQLLLNRVGFALAEAHDVRDAHDAGDWRPSDYRALARELECWCEAYAKEWNATSQPSELHRIQETVWKAADELRRISR